MTACYTDPSNPSWQQPDAKRSNITGRLGRQISNELHPQEMS
jgi:hypothetical protein